MKKFVSEIKKPGHIAPYLKVLFDGSITNKEGVETWLRSLDCVYKANATLDDNVKLSACVYPIDETSMEEFKATIDQCLEQWFASSTI